MRNETVLAALGALTLSLAGCPKKDDDFTPQIHVAPGAAARVLWIASHRPDAGPAVSAVETSVHPARIHAMLAGEELAGPGAAGKAGDLVLENDEVVFVIERSGASLVDAADARTRIDELERAVTTSRTFAYENVRSGTTPDGAAWVLVEGHTERALRVRTRYTLGAPDRAVMIESELKNEGDQPTSKLSLGDMLLWGGQAFAPGKSLGFSGPSKGPFVGAIGHGASYALTSTDGEIEGVSNGSVTETFHRKDVVLGPGERVQYARILVVGERADSASLVAELAKMAGEEMGVLQVALVDETGKKLHAPAGALVSLAQGGAEVLSIASTVDGFAAEVPSGVYDLSYGRSSATRRITVEAGKGMRAVLTVSGDKP